MDNDDNIENNVIDFICMIFYDDLILIWCYLGMCNIGGRYMIILNSMGLFSKYFFYGWVILVIYYKVKFFLLINIYN